MEKDLQRLRDLALSDSGFLFDPYTGATFSLNASGRVILDSLKKGMEREEILETLEDSFTIGEADLHRDIDEFVHLLREAGLITATFTL